MPLAIGTRLGPYEVISALGAGGMGEVYRARDIKLGRDVALKILPEIFASDPDRLARFQREAQLLASLNHQNIAAIHGLEESPSTASTGSGQSTVRALVLELVEGPTLADRIAQGPIPLDEALPIACQIAEALEAAHEHGIIHRDLKPANIKVRPDGAVKVLDFGLAKLAEAPGRSGRAGRAGGSGVEDFSQSPTLTTPAMTQMGVIMGTAAYMSPEQAKGRAADKRSDIWAFGCVLSEMISGKPLFTGDTVSEILAGVIKDEPSVDSLPAAVRPTIARCLRKDPRKRWQAIGDVRVALEEGVPPATPQVRSRPFVWIAAAAICFVALVSLAAIHFRETPLEQSAVRFEISVPGSRAVSFLKLSPDGRQLAFVGSIGGINQVFVRSLDAVEARALAGTEGASYPFWSPDSRTLGFFAQGKLKRILVSGGSAQTICDAPNARGGAWNRDGVILFAPDALGGLYRVPPAGGAPVQVTKPESPQASHRFPEFISGNLFLYVQPPSGGLGVWVGSLDGTPPVRVVQDVDSGASYVAPATPGGPGYLVFRLRGSNALVAQSFDPDRRLVLGDIIPLGERVGLGPGSIQLVSTSENGMLAYVSATEEPDRELAWLDRTGRRVSVVGKPGLLQMPALSPDRSKAAVTVRTASGLDIWLQDVATGALSRFTFGNRDASTGFTQLFSAAVWSADGSVLFFVSNPPGGFSLYQKPVSGAGKEELVMSGRPNGYFYDSSPDGHYLVYSQAGETTGDDLWLLPLGGDRKPVPFSITPAQERQGQFSPDGRWMAYVSDDGQGPQVFVQPIPPTGSKWMISVAGGDQPRWRRDGKELFYVSADRKLMTVATKTVGSTFEPGASQVLFDNVPFLSFNRPITYSPSADGQRFLGLVPVGDAAVAPPITVVLNWQAGLKN